jgi:hypothetical protein
MRWHTVVGAVVAALKADAALVTALGGASRIDRIEATATRVIPSVRYTVVSDVEEEVMNPIILQLDYWATNRTQAITIEERIRAVLNRYVRRTFGGIDMQTSFDGARDSNDPDVGVVHRQLDFRFVPVKRRIPT